MLTRHWHGPVASWGLAVGMCQGRTTHHPTKMSGSGCRPDWTCVARTNNLPSSQVLRLYTWMVVDAYPEYITYHAASRSMTGCRADHWSVSWAHNLPSSQEVREWVLGWPLGCVQDTGTSSSCTLWTTGSKGWGKAVTPPTMAVWRSLICCRTWHSKLFIHRHSCKNTTRLSGSLALRQPFQHFAKKQFFLVA